MQINLFILLGREDFVVKILNAEIVKGLTISDYCRL